MDGDLHVTGPLFCLGRLVVKGSLHANEVFTGLGIEVQGELLAVYIDVSGGVAVEPDFEAIAEDMSAWIPGAQRADELEGKLCLQRLVDPSTLEDLQLDSESIAESVRVGGDCTVAGDVKVAGSVWVGGLFNLDSALVDSVQAKTIITEGDLDCGTAKAYDSRFKETCTAGLRRVATCLLGATWKRKTSW